jgi:MATE family multidrug resistance protein
MNQRPALTEARANVRLAWPLILTNLAQLGLTTTDLVLIGRFGANELAGAALAIALYQAMMLFSMGTISAVLPLLARELGQRDPKPQDVRRIVQQGFWSAGILVAIIWLFLWQAEAFFIFVGQEPWLAAKAAELMHTLQWALLPYLGYVVLRAFVATLGQPLWALVAVGAALVFNAVAAWALIFGHLGLPALGLAGAGIATSAASVLMFVVLAAITQWRPVFRRFHLFAGVWQSEARRLGAFWRLGLPMGLTTAFETSIFYAAANMMGWLGPASLAAHAIVIQIVSLAFMVPIGFGQAATVRVGLAYGANDLIAIRRAGWTAWGLGAGFMAASASAMLLLPSLFISAFIDLADPANRDIIAIARNILIVGAMFQIVDGIQVVCVGMLRGLQDTTIPMVLALVGYWGIGLPLGGLLAFPAGLGGVGVWLGLASGLGTVAVLMTLRWRRLTGERGRIAERLRAAAA